MDLRHRFNAIFIARCDIAGRRRALEGWTVVLG
jgi:hypothetical protein